MQLLLKISLLLFFLGFIQTGRSEKPVVDPQLILTQITPTSAYMSWDAFGNSGQYAVTVTDLNTGKTITMFNTSNTNAVISGLTAGHTIRCEVSRNSTAIIGDLIVSG